MSQMRLIWWPKCSLSATTTSATAISTGSSARTGKSRSKTEMVEGEEAGENCSCGCVGKLVRKMRRQGRLLRAAAARSTSSSKASSFQCRYDPLSYALNFDSSGGGGCMLDDEDYYHFCAFSSRFVAAANPNTRFTPSPPTLPSTAAY